MPARTTRDAARERLRKIFEESLERVIPADESAPLRGATFRDWEDQADAFDRAVTGALLEERAALDGGARAEDPGACPRCGSRRVYLERREARAEVRTPHGAVVVDRQSARCRACGRSFSPSGA